MPKEATSKKWQPATKKLPTIKGETANPLSLLEVSRCKLCANLGQDHVPSDGNPYADLMIIGQSPGEQEVLDGKPFTGPAGSLVTYMLDECGLSREEVYIANVLKCRPPGNRPAQQEEMTMCWQTWLHAEIMMVKPKLILLLGKDAHQAVLPRDLKFGHLVRNKSKRFHYLTSYHPAYFLRQKLPIEKFIKGVGEQVAKLLQEIGE